MKWTLIKDFSLDEFCIFRHFLDNNIFCLKESKVIIVFYKSENSIEDLFIIVHWCISIHLENLIIKIYLNTLFLKFPFKFEVILPLNWHIRVFVILFKIVSIHTCHVFVLFIKTVFDIQEEFFIFENLIMKMHWVYFQVFKLILNRKRLNILCIVIILKSLVGI